MEGWAISPITDVSTRLSRFVLKLHAPFASSGDDFSGHGDLGATVKGLVNGAVAFG